MPPTEQDNTGPRPTPGMTVKSRFSEEWGSGTVLGVQGEGARVLFTAHPSKKPVLVPVRSLVVTRAGDWTAAAQSFAQRSEGRATTKSSRPASKKKFATTNQEEAVKLFLERFPGGFGADAYTAAERDSKWQAHQLFQQHLGGPRLAELLKDGKVQDCVRHALEAEAKTNLLSVFEKSRLKKALADDTFAASVLGALADVLAEETPTEATFTKYLTAVGAMPARGAQRAATWPVATIFPFLASPERHLFVKPRAAQAAAERLKLDLQYAAELNWATYSRALQLASGLKAQLAEHGCRDFIDVQSFISVTG